MEEQSKYHFDFAGNKIWYLPSKGQDYWHRENGPAFEQPDGRKEWWLNNKLHRLSGPAVENVDGSNLWWADDKILDGKDIEIWLKEDDIDLTTEASQVAFKLRWT